jgi:hypothetical protein
MLRPEDLRGDTETRRYDWGDGIVRWRGVPVSPTTWQGKKIK